MAEVINVGAFVSVPDYGDISGLEVINTGLVVSSSDPFSAVEVIQAGLVVSTRADHTLDGVIVPSTVEVDVEEGDMIYTDIIFPECISYGSTGSAVYVTDKIEVESGREQRNQRRKYPKHEYFINMENLPADEVSQVMNIWHVCTGDFAAFLFLDPMDHTSDNTSAALSGGEVSATDQSLGVIQAGVSGYELYKTYSAGSRTQTRRIRFPKEGTLVVAIDGDEYTRWEYDYDAGLLIFTLPLPSLTATLSKSGEIISGADFSALAPGDLVYIDGWSNGAYNFVAGVDDPLRVVAASGTELRLETYGGGSYGLVNFTDEEVTINSTIPPIGAAITAGYYFYVPVRFGDGNNAEHEITAGMQDSVFANFTSIQLREVFE